MRLLLPWNFLLYKATIVWVLVTSIAAAGQQQQQHVDNYAVIVATSKYFFNYRHSANALGLYRYLREVGKFPDSNIILMLADDLICDARNPFPGQVYMAEGPTDFSAEIRANFPSVHSKDDEYVNVEIDYKGDDVNAENFVRVLTGEHKYNEPNNRRLPSDSMSNVLIYMAGHGGDGFIKFNDYEEILKEELARTLRKMKKLGRYNEVLFIVDSCQSFTLCDNFDEVPHSYCIGSSLSGQNAYAHHADINIGVTVIDQFSRKLLKYLYKNVTAASHTEDNSFHLNNWSLKEFIDGLNPAELNAQPALSDAGSRRKGYDALFKDFFLMSERVVQPKETKQVKRFPGLKKIIEEAYDHVSVIE